MKQQSFSSFEQSQKKKRTKREVFLGEMDEGVPWARLEALIAPYYVKSTKGRPQMALSVMLRIYFLQQWYGLSDPGAEEALYDMHALRDFAGLDLGRDAIPDETTILNFRRLLERRNLSEALFAEVSRYLEERALLLRGGTIMDATLIAASPSPKNKAGKRDPEMSQTKKGNQWYFGAKVHVGVDACSGLVHTAKLTKSSRHDAALTDDLIRDDDRAVFGDKGYVSDKRKRAARADGVFWGVKDKLYTTKTPITAADLLNDRVLPFNEEHDLPVLRILTDRGTEYCGRVDKHDFLLFLAINDIDHTKTKVKSPQTNGICERFHKTILQEFYQVAFRKKLYDGIDALQADLDDWLHHYNHERTHQGKMCCGRTPIETMSMEKKSGGKSF